MYCNICFKYIDYCKCRGYEEIIKENKMKEDAQVYEVKTEKTVMVPKVVVETKLYYKGKEINPISALSLSLPERRTTGSLHNKGFWLRPDLKWSVVLDDSGIPVLIAEAKNKE